MQNSDRHRNNLATIDLLSEMHQNSVIMIVLCGIPGCGKSTFADYLVKQLQQICVDRWISFNQDRLGSRMCVIERTSDSLRSRQCVIIDRCNFNVSQREHWIKLAQDFIIDAVVCLVLPEYDNTALCITRAFDRSDSDGIHHADTDWNKVCLRMKSEFQLPVLNEGFSGVYICKSHDDLVAFIDALKRASTREYI